MRWYQPGITGAPISAGPNILSNREAGRMHAASEEAGIRAGEQYLKYERPPVTPISTDPSAVLNSTVRAMGLTQ
jgi:hypothetical protein